MSNYRPENLTPAERDALLRAKPELSWSATLPPTEDFKPRTETVKVPKDLEPGFYWLISSHNKDFNTVSNNVVAFCDFWVSDMALVMRNHQGEGLIEGFVLNAITGDPIANALVEIWHRQRDNRFTLGERIRSDKNGFFSYQSTVQFEYLVQAEKDGQKLATGNNYQNFFYPIDPGPFNRTVFFTDRSLYRPGQTISYKGICLSVDQNGDNYKTIANQDVTVIFQDPNGKEITKHNVRSNDYGSFSGSFTAPRDRLMGQMMIRTVNPAGQATFNVEEYKRPKFQVTLDAPKTPAKLNTPVQLTGKATAYTGSAVGGAKVRYRVSRETRYPDWYGWFYWWRPAPSMPAQEIAHGFAITEVDGSFPIQFLAKPDPAVPEKAMSRSSVTRSRPDVTDTTGETRSNQRTIQVAYTGAEGDARSRLVADRCQGRRSQGHDRDH